MSTNVAKTLQFNCTTCPSECLLTVEVERGADGAVVVVRSVTGNSCPRGDTFAHRLTVRLHLGSFADQGDVEIDDAAAARRDQFGGMDQELI